MKLTIKGEHGFVLTAENPDESIKQYFTDKILQALQSEWRGFLGDVESAMRHLEPGEERVLESKPISVTLRMPAEKPEPAPIAAEAVVG